MAHIKLNLTIRALPLKLLLILGIIYGILAKPTVVTPLKTDISSPVPFITQTLPEISTRKIDENTLTMLATIATNLRENDYVDNVGIMDGKHKDKDRDKDVEFNDFIISEEPDRNMNNDAKGNNNNDNDYVETVVKYVDITTPTSMEQQDGPIVPPTTITFTNVASASIWGESSGGGLAFDAGVIFNGATPPYAAVDDNYGYRIFALVQQIKFEEQKSPNVVANDLKVAKTTTSELDRSEEERKGKRTKTIKVQLAGAKESTNEKTNRNQWLRLQQQNISWSSLNEALRAAWTNAVVVQKKETTTSVMLKKIQNTLIDFFFYITKGNNNKK
uniref:Uncharacterized protein n=1 Tax=Glossina austeni TaxID=7395 RepID=A0A1A9UVI7_GLOAU